MLGAFHYPELDSIPVSSLCHEQPALVPHSRTSNTPIPSLHHFQISWKTPKYRYIHLYCVSTIHSGRSHVQCRCYTHISPSDRNIVNLNSSLHRIDFHCSSLWGLLVFVIYGFMCRCFSGISESVGLCSQCSNGKGTPVAAWNSCLFARIFVRSEDHHCHSVHRPCTYAGRMLLLIWAYLTWWLLPW